MVALTFSGADSVGETDVNTGAELAVKSAMMFTQPDDTLGSLPLVVLTPPSMTALTLIVPASAPAVPTSTEMVLKPSMPNSTRTRPLRYSLIR